MLNNVEGIQNDHSLIEVSSSSIVHLAFIPDELTASGSKAGFVDPVNLCEMYHHG